ncbi:hypothetical protein Scep_014476 [Stephania cephalantha]|uniref:Uncharacterized protein n=1 Tax=Stephania cephalantha TaxID=152367 RepID=A0AAP0J231_9MAGN
MAYVPHSAVALSATSSASDLLRSSRNGFSGVPLRALGRARLDGIKRNFSVVAKIRKGKKHEYPWPDDADPNVKVHGRASAGGAFAIQLAKFRGARVFFTRSLSFLF